MTGPLLHVMPLMKPHRPIVGDPYITYVSFMSEFNGRPPGYTGPATDLMNIPKDTANNAPLFISGSPHRYPLDTDLWSPAPLGISDVACYEADLTPGYGSAIVVGDCSSIALGGSDFTIEMKVRATADQKDNACYFAGRWKSGGGYSWSIDYYYALRQMRFSISCNGTTTEFADNKQAKFRMSSTGTNDGVTVDDFFDDQWHTITVARSGRYISISIDGAVGYKMIDTSITASTAIYDPPGDTSLLHIGSIPADLTGIRTSGLSFRGKIKYLHMDVGGPALTVDFNEYWSYWVLGHYPQDKHVQQLPYNALELQEEMGLRKLSGYVGPQWPYDAELDFVDHDFSIELFGAYLGHNDNYSQQVVGYGWPTAGSKTWRFLIHDDPAGDGHSGRLIFQYSLDGTNVQEMVLKTGLVSGVMQEYDLAITRLGGTLRAYIDGVRITTASISGSLNTSSGLPLSFYANSLGNGDVCRNETRLKAIRLTDEHARYINRSYRVPSLPLPKTST